MSNSNQQIFLGWEDDLVPPGWSQNDFRSDTLIGNPAPPVLKLAEFDLERYLPESWEENVGSWVVTVDVVKLEDPGYIGPPAKIYAPIFFQLEFGAGGVQSVVEVDPGSSVSLPAPYCRVLATWDPLLAIQTGGYLPRRARCRVTVTRSFSGNDATRTIQFVPNLLTKIPPYAGSYRIIYPWSDQLSLVQASEIQTFRPALGGGPLSDIVQQLVEFNPPCALMSSIITGQLPRVVVNPANFLQIGLNFAGAPPVQVGRLRYAVAV